MNTCEEANLEIIRKRWDEIEQRISQDNYPAFQWLVPLVEALGRHPRIGQLFPYTSHATLCLSRCTRYPFSNDCPHTDAVEDGVFRVYGTNYVTVMRTHNEHRWREGKYEVLGEGSVLNAVLLIDAALPPKCGPAIEGDSDDVRRLDEKSVLAEAVRALHAAAAHGNLEKVAALLKEGVDINAADYDGYTALTWAVLSDKGKMVRLLLHHGANVHVHTHGGETALRLAAFKKRSEIIHLLRQAGAVE